MDLEREITVRVLDGLRRDQYEPDYPDEDRRSYNFGRPDANDRRPPQFVYGSVTKKYGD